MSPSPRTPDPAPCGPGYAVLDFETTGPVPGRDRAVEVAVVRCGPSGRVEGEWTTLLHPGQHSTGPVHVHGIRPQDVVHAPAFPAVAAHLAALLAGRVVVAHSAAFDLHVLRTELARAGVLLPQAPDLAHLCTLEASRTHLPALRRRRLVDCCAATGVHLSDAHTALGDARATAGLLRAYLRLAAPRAREAMDDLVDRAAAQPWPPVPAPQDPAVALGRQQHPAALADPGCPAARRAVLRARAAQVADDGPRRAQAALTALAAALGLEPPEATAAPEAVRAERRVRAAAHLAPLPASWPHGEPLHLGDRVAFTGGDDVQRRLLERRTREAGLAVAGAVSRTTAALVTDDPASSTAKARTARALGTRTVDPELFAVLLDHVQPAAAPGGWTAGDAVGMSSTG